MFVGGAPLLRHRARVITSRQLAFFPVLSVFARNLSLKHRFRAKNAKTRKEREEWSEGESMMRRMMFIAALALVVLTLASTSKAQSISGDYIETRSADVWTGPCVANGEMNLAGDQAILAWRINKGEWKGVSLDGLSVVAVVKANATLGDQYNNPYPAKAVIIVDEKACGDQQKALVEFAQSMAGELLKNVVRVEVAPIRVEVSSEGGHYAKTLVRAGNIAGIQTRAINGKDHMCGNEDIFYQPLAEMTHSMPAVAELDQFIGAGLDVSWTVHGKRSAFVGTFAR
jgi:hypothetical protein